MERREQLLAWIEETKRLQRRLAIVFAALGVVVLGLFAWSTSVGALSLISLVLVAICSFWITTAHNITHRQKLAELERTGGKGVQTDHRRWHAKR